jgi:26S proteasome regulatory subunit N6
MAPANSARIEEAKGLTKTDPRKAEALYKEIISKMKSEPPRNGN